MNRGIVLVTGGCGYIGSHTIVDLIREGFEVISADNLSNSSEAILEGVRKITGQIVRNYAVDLCDPIATRRIFEEHPKLVGVIHFAALKQVEESVFHPLRYFRNNLDSLLNVMESMTEFGIRHLIFSSSCSVYGNVETLPATEAELLKTPESPYARTKQMGEAIIQDFCLAQKDFSAVLLRYFNPAGAHESAFIGEAPSNKASNLVPVITETAIGKRAQMAVFGNDYPTRDGSCVRDFIHVMDLAQAHTKALELLLLGKNEQPCEIFNLGIGEGVTVLEAIAAFESTTGQKLNYQIGPRRAGDVVAIYANYEKAARQLGWQPQHSIEDIMRSAWAWEQVRG